MRKRTMPLGLQKYMFKKLFEKWNAWREREHKDYDVSAEMDNIDWEIALDEGATFHTNLHSLARQYPKYTWYNFDAEEERHAKEHETAVAELVERAEKQYEVEPVEPVPEEAFRCLNIDCPVNETTKESFALGTGISKQVPKKMNWPAITSLRHLRWSSSAACAMQSNKEEDEKKEILRDRGRYHRMPRSWKLELDPLKGLIWIVSKILSEDRLTILGREMNLSAPINEMA